MKRLHLLGLLLVALVSPTMLEPVGAQNASRMDILSVAGKPVDPQNGVVVDIMRAGETFDVEVGCYGVPDNHHVWLLLKARDGREYGTFGPAKRQRRDVGGICLVTDVPISVLSGQRRLFEIRVASIPREQAVPPTVTSLGAFEAVSTPPTQIAVLRSVPDLGELRIVTITGLTAEPGRELSVDGNGDVGGVKPAVSDWVYLVIHDVNTDGSRVVGPADVHGGTWYMRDVPFREPGHPHWRLVDVFAFSTSSPTPFGGLDYLSVREHVKATSQPVRLWLKDEAAPPAVRAPLITFSRYTTSDGGSARISGTNPKIRLSVQEFSLSGKVQGIPQGRALFVVHTSSNTPMWFVTPGAALLSGTEWTFPRIRLTTPAGAVSTPYEVYVIAASPSIPTGPVDYDTWRRQATGISPRLAVERGVSPNAVEAEIEVSISSVEGNTVIAAASEVPPDHFVYAGRVTPGTQVWDFVLASRSSEDTFTAVGLAHSGHALADGSADMFVTIVTNSRLPALRLATSDWRQRAIAASPVFSTSPLGPARASGTVGSRWEGSMLQMISVSLLTLVALAAVLVILQHLFGVVAPVLHEIADACKRLREYLLTQLRNIPRPDAVSSAISVLMLAVGVVMTVSYLPVYEDVMRSALVLSRKVARSVSLLIVLSLVMIGLVAEITATYGPRRNADGTQMAGFGSVFALTFIGLMAAAVLAFQGLIYYEYYTSHAPEGSLIPVALATAAVFISATEMINAYWVTRLGAEFYTWLAFHVLMCPLSIVEHGCHLLENVFLGIRPASPRTPPYTL